MPATIGLCHVHYADHEVVQMRLSRGGKSRMAHLNIKWQIAKEDSSVALIHDAASRTAMRALTCSVHPDVPSINLKPQHPLIQS